MSDEPPASQLRLAQLRRRLDEVHRRIDAGCAAARREPAEVTLVVVTKSYPASDIAKLSALGVRDLGENRDQEAASKWHACAGLGLTWHFIGRLQSNKARSVARYADLIHSVDRVALVGPLARGAREAGRVLHCLIQVSLDGDPARGGAVPSDVPALAGGLADRPELVVRGIMAVAPLGVSPTVAFAALPGIRERLNRDHPGADLLSAGMSADLEAALAVGATHLRVGAAILGPRPALE